MMHIITVFYKSNNWLLAFIIISFISIALSFVSRHYLINEEIVYKSLSEHLPTERLEDAMANRVKYEWLNYMLIPIVKFTLFIITSTVILTGVYLNAYKISFKKILTVVAFSGFVVLIPNFIKIVYFFFFKESFSLEEFQNFHPHSLLFYVDKQEIAKWFYYPIYLINFTELLYWFALVIGIKLISNLSFAKSFLLVSQTYILTLFVWAVFVVFVSINLT